MKKLLMFACMSLGILMIILMSGCTSAQIAQATGTIGGGVLAYQVNTDGNGGQQALNTAAGAAIGYGVGTVVGDAITFKECPNCHRRNYKDARCCDQCGTSLMNVPTN